MLEEQTKPVSVEQCDEAESTSDSGVLVMINDQALLNKQTKQNRESRFIATSDRNFTKKKIAVLL